MHFRNDGLVRPQKVESCRCVAALPAHDRRAVEAPEPGQLTLFVEPYNGTETVLLPGTEMSALLRVAPFDEQAAVTAVARLEATWWQDREPLSLDPSPALALRFLLVSDGDRLTWNTRKIEDTPIVQTLKQFFDVTVQSQVSQCSLSHTTYLFADFAAEICCSGRKILSSHLIYFNILAQRFIHGLTT